MPKNKKSPATTSATYDRMAPAWNKVQTVLDGTEAMRRAQQRFLPQHHGEEDKPYKERLERNTLLNLTKLTLNSWVGRPFSKPITFAEVPSVIEDFFEDIDLVGNDIQVFSRDWFSDGLAKAFSHCLIDFPRTDNVEGTRTLADDKAQNVRPHWIHYQPEQVIFADAEVIDGQEVLREVRFLEEISHRDDFAEVFEPQIRRMYFDDEQQGIVELWRLKEPEKRDKDEWFLKETYGFSLPVIPLVTFYSDREAFMMGTPPLEDLADLNIAHWQSTSDQRAVLTVARFPILACSGVTAKDQVTVIGPRKILTATDPKGKFYYVEHSGDAINAGQVDLESLESSMGEYGSEFLKKKPGGQTATARALDTAESTSALQDMAVRFGHALTLALQYTAMWMKLESGGSATLHTKFGIAGGDQAELRTLTETRRLKDISRTAFLEELKRRSVLGEEFDQEADEQLLQDEALLFMPVDLTTDEDEDDDGSTS